MLDQGHSQKKRKRVGKRSALAGAREMDALNHAKALSKSLEDILQLYLTTRTNVMQS